MLCAFDAVISSAAREFGGFRPFHLRIEGLDRRVNVAAVECSIGATEFRDRALSFLLTERPVVGSGSMTAQREHNGERRDCGCGSHAMTLHSFLIFEAVFPLQKQPAVSLVYQDRGEQAETIFAQVAGQVAGRFAEIGTHHNSETEAVRWWSSHSRPHPL